MATVSLGKLIGAGGFSRTVAIKRPHAHLAADSNLVKMFLDEARLAARIHHPNVVSTLDVVHSGGDLFLVMEYIEGLSLGALRAISGETESAVPRGVALAIVQGTLEGLHAAHEARDETGAPLNLIHRDVSPQNILVGSDGVSRVVDFGVAKADGRLQATTDVTAQKGKLAYMAPERLAGHEADRSDDLWSLAVVFWEMLTGRRLFAAPHTAMLVTKLLNDPIPVPSELGAPSTYDAFFRCALSRDRSARFHDAPAMATAIQALGESAAGPRTVAEWVESRAADQLQERARLIMEMDRALSPRGAGAVPMDPVAPHDGNPFALTTPGGAAVMTETSVVANDRRSSTAIMSAVAESTASSETTHTALIPKTDGGSPTARKLPKRASLALIVLATATAVGVTTFRSGPSRSMAPALGNTPLATSLNPAPGPSAFGVTPSAEPATTVSASAQPSPSTAASVTRVGTASSANAVSSHRGGQSGPARGSRPQPPHVPMSSPVPLDPMRMDSRR
jgi:serine/threonine-protein kinase